MLWSTYLKELIPCDGANAGTSSGAAAGIGGVCGVNVIGLSARNIYKSYNYNFIIKSNTFTTQRNVYPYAILHLNTNSSNLHHFYVGQFFMYGSYFLSLYPEHLNWKTIFLSALN